MANTTRAGLPYPVGTDRVMDGDNAIQALAERLDGSPAGALQSVPYAIASGQVTVVFNAATQAQVGVTFPAGRFSQPPRLQHSIFSTPSATLAMLRSSGSVSASAYNIVANTAAAITGNIVVDWTAIQMTASSGSG